MPYCQYLWGAGYVDHLILRDRNADARLYNGMEERRYFTADANHNVTAMLESDGDAVERYAYTAYGEATVYSPTWTSPSAPAIDGPLYAGYWFDAETSLYQVRNRYYDAAIGTFVSRDPIGYSGGINLYEYVGDSPMIRVDPSGLAWWWPPDWFTPNPPPPKPPTIYPIRSKPPIPPGAGAAAVKAAKKWAEIQKAQGSRFCQCAALKTAIAACPPSIYKKELTEIYVLNCMGAGMP